MTHSSPHTDVPVWTKGRWKNGKLLRPVIARVLDMPENFDGALHQHPWGQLAYASRGIMKVNTPGADFIIPPERAVWLPTYTPHCVSTRYGVSFRSLYIDNPLALKLPDRTTSLNVSPLLRELILEVTHWGDDYLINEANERLLQVLVDQIESADRAPLFLKAPGDKRLLTITHRLNQTPADNTSLEEWSQRIGATSRTLNRLFKKETGMGFVEWRQRLRILYSMERIERGEKLTSIALDLGYESSSAFITVFRKHLNASPGQYLKAAKDSKGTLYTPSDTTELAE
ncbi:helix-turn-helix domain-containing protein [Pleionea sp. CnH1-48]|uniref:AraC family transcriptional regulator n=1 Tax=Pleionea sp. CnH1-48 TaxID=2954494 RepID=UPI002097D77E|nr:helix-turn-helix transcriptional regulator [Pleionea sp. CnH1-48]MCO7224242.1 helix-turn-helix transcriptional regulator [Pleionea sp. CnH1-48]